MGRLRNIYFSALNQCHVGHYFRVTITRQTMKEERVPGNE